MKSPWLRIPASDYEAHMTLPEVAQAQTLSKLMASVLTEYAPTSIGVVLCLLSIMYQYSAILKIIVSTYYRYEETMKRKSAILAMKCPAACRGAVHFCFDF